MLLQLDKLVHQHIISLLPQKSVGLLEQTCMYFKDVASEMSYWKVLTALLMIMSYDNH